MKSIFKDLLLIVSLIILFAFLVSCQDNQGDNGNNGGDNNPGYGDNGNNGGNENEDIKNSVDCIEKSTFYEANDKYQVVDSYVLDDGNYYYFYFLGTIDYVPLNLSTSEGVYFNGNAMELSFSLSKTDSTTSEKTITNAIQNSVSLTTSTYVKGSVDADFGLYKSKIEAGIQCNATTGITKTATESFKEAVSRETTFEQSITYKMSQNDPVGFYFYTPIASMKVYEVVVYNPNTCKVEHMSTYSQYGAAMPGLFYSRFSFLDSIDCEITFDENKIPNFEKPTTMIDSRVTASVDANGGSCGVKSLDLNIGQPYGALPVPERHGYIFKGWKTNGASINEKTIVASGSTIVADWELRTSFSFGTEGTISVDSTSKLNPFGFLVPEMSGETRSEGVDIATYFDFDTLKAQGYKMRIVLDYDAKHGLLALWGLKYKFNFKSNGQNVIEISDGVDSSSYVRKHNCSEYISLDKINGSLDFTVSTENVITLDVKNLSITVEFTK